MTEQQLPDHRGPILFLVLLALVGLIVVAGGLGQTDDDGPGPEPIPPPAEPTNPFLLEPLEPESAEPSQPTESTEPEDTAPEDTEPEDTEPESTDPAAPVTLPKGRAKVFGGDRFLVAYYGTAGTGALGVLGETDPAEMHRRVHRAARPFRDDAGEVQVVYELIVTIADRGPGRDGDYSHDIGRAAVQRYIDAAHRNDALLLLDIQPGRSDFLTVARRWEWALSHPWVGLAIDPEWRMGRRQVPARVIGHVGAAEVNRTSLWLSQLTRRKGLPEKLFVVHQFRTSMITRIERIKARPGLAIVQHADGFGTRRQKLATYRTIARPRQFTMGMKLFYDEDIRRFDASDVRRIRPRVRFVSYQ